MDPPLFFSLAVSHEKGALGVRQLSTVAELLQKIIDGPPQDFEYLQLSPSDGRPAKRPSAQ